MTETILPQMQLARNDQIVYTACLSAKHGLPVNGLVALAQPNVDARRTAYYLEVLGAAQYRAGQHAAAVATLRAAVELNGNGGSNWMRLFLAMAHHQQGDAETARAWLAKAIPSEGASWEERPIYERPHAEAKALMTEGEVRGPPATLSIATW